MGYINTHVQKNLRTGDAATIEGQRASTVDQYMQNSLNKQPRSIEQRLADRRARRRQQERNRLAQMSEQQRAERRERRRQQSRQRRQQNRENRLQNARVMHQSKRTTIIAEGMICDRAGDTNDDGTIRDEQTKAKNSYEQWTYHESRELLKLLAAEVNNDGLSRKEKITLIVLPKLNAEFAKNKDYNHVRNKLTNWKQKLEATKDLDALGIGWDPVKQKFVASDEMWEKLKKANCKAASLRHKIFEDYEELKLVVNHYYPGRRNAIVRRRSAMPTAERQKDNAVGIHMERQRDNAVGIQGSTPPATPSPPDNDTPLSISQGPASAPGSSSRASQRKRKAAVLETPEGSHAKNLISVRESTHEIAAELRNHNEHSDSKLLDAVDRVMEEMKWRAYEVFTTPTMKAAFLRMLDSERLRFLLFKLKQATSRKN